MRAVVYQRYGSPDELRIAEVVAPVPRAHEVLIRIHAVSLNGSDREGLVGSPAYARIGGWRKPGHPILGSDIAGVVVAAGANHREFREGDEVFGELPGYRGGLAEYVCTHGRTLLAKPPELSFEQAAAIPQGGVIALNGIRTRGRARPGRQVLINGAGGSAGIFAIQLARLAGAQVTAVDGGHKAAFMRSLGADHVIDYQREDYTARGAHYDLVLDLIAHRSVFAAARAVRPSGTYYIVGGSTRVLLQTALLGVPAGLRGGKRLRVLAVSQNRADLAAISTLCVQGDVVPVIDSCFPLEQSADALRRLVDGQACGKVVVRPTPLSQTT